MQNPAVFRRGFARRGWVSVAFAVALVALIASTGCQAPQVRSAGRSVERRPIHTVTLGHGPDTVLVLAGIHGSEPAGVPLVQRLQECLARQPRLLAGRTVVLVPVANPDGLARGTRGNLRGVDLNRNFPADNFATGHRGGAEPLSEPESLALYALLRRVRPQRIVSIHQPLTCIDYDGPAEELARAMAAHTDLPVRRLGSRPGSLGSYAGVTLGIPIITLELPGSASKLSPNELWQRYGRALLAAIRYPELID